MTEINKFRVFNRLKTVYRSAAVAGRKESSAEHSWSCLMLADFFLSNSKMNIDRIKVYELLMYHDVVEIEAGDEQLRPGATESDKKSREKKASRVLAKNLPRPLDSKFLRLFHEFEEQKTIESRFAKAIDALDAVIHELDHKHDWKGWSKEYLLEKKLHLVERFPELKDAFNTILQFAIKNKYFDG